jgi:hypothetical protein
MEYFILSQDQRVVQAIRPVDIDKLVTDNGLASERWDNLDKLPVQYFLEEDSDPEYVDFIASPVPLVSDRLKQLYQKFDAKIFFKPVALADSKQMRQELYWLMNPPRCACLAEQTEFNKDRSVKRLVIDSRKAAGNWIFRVDGILERLFVVNLGVAEAMLRRDFSGVKLIRIDSVKNRHKA